jgi:protein TonB
MTQATHSPQAVVANSTPIPAPNEPLGRVLGLGRNAVRSGMTLGLVGALVSHTVLGLEAFQMSEAAVVRSFAAAVHFNLRERLQRTMDLDIEEPPPAPEPEPPPEPTPPEPEPVKVAPPPPAAKAPAPTPAPEPPPPAAQAGKVLTAEPDPNEPLDLTGNTFVTGTGDRYVGGVTASAGTGQKPTRNRGAAVNGVEGGQGTIGAPAYQGVDLSRPAKWIGGRLQNCGFPPESDVAQINYMKVGIVVSIDASGKPTSVASIGGDPGYGFFERARRCALADKFEPALNKAGKPMATTIKMTVRFTRN